MYAFNSPGLRKVVEPGTEVIVVESMGKWIPNFENTPESIPPLSKIIRYRRETKQISCFHALSY